MHAYDVEFGWAINNAARGEPGKLACMLRSDRQLGPGERELLAQFVLGEWKATTGGRPKGSTALTGDQQRMIADEYENRLEKGRAERKQGGKGEKSDDIIKSLCENYAVRTTTIREAIRDARPIIGADF